MRKIIAALIFCLVFVFLEGVASAEYYVGDNFPSDENLVYTVQSFFPPPSKLKIVGKRQGPDEVFTLFVDRKVPAGGWIVEIFKVYKTDRRIWMVESEHFERCLVVRKVSKQE